LQTSPANENINKNKNRRLPLIPPNIVKPSGWNSPD